MDMDGLLLQKNVMLETLNCRFYLKQRLNIRIRDKYHDSGVLVDEHKNIYNGEFRNGYKEGMGKFQFFNGDVYTGEVFRNLYHGKVLNRINVTINPF